MQYRIRLNLKQNSFECKVLKRSSRSWYFGYNTEHKSITKGPKGLG